MRRAALSFPVAAMGVLALLALAGVTAAHIRKVATAVDDTADVRLPLPGQVAQWRGEDMLFCQNEQCQRSFRVSELTGRATCPVCGGPLDPMTLAEHTLLPPDTLISRKLYTGAGGEEIYATLLLSGSEQRSIHRPEQCLPAQGCVIEQLRQTTIAVPGSGPLRVMLLNARQPASGVTEESSSFLYTYWFVGGGHETPSHFERLGWVAWDNLVHGCRPRWAYVSIQAPITGSMRAAEERSKSFIRDLYPIIKNPKSQIPNPKAPKSKAESFSADR